MVVILLFANNQLYSRNAAGKTSVITYTTGERVSVRTEADIAANTYDLNVNGKLFVSNVSNHTFDDKIKNGCK